MYTAQSKEDVLGTLDSYTHGIKCLPRDWDADHKIEPPAAPVKRLGDELEEIDEDRRKVMFDTIIFYFNIIHIIQNSKRVYLKGIIITPYAILS